MNGKPGVLAVMDDLRILAQPHMVSGDYDRFRDARDTMAELVAADKAYDAAKASRIEADNRITLGDRSGLAFVEQANAHHAYDRAVERRRAALAAFRGEQP